MQPEIKRKIQRLQSYYNDLSSYLKMDSDEVLGDKTKLSALERSFQLMADEAFDVNSAIAYEFGNDIPESNKSTFLALSDLGILDRSFAAQIAESARVRNDIVHDYEKVSKKDMIERMSKFAELYKEYIKILINRFV